MDAAVVTALAGAAGTTLAAYLTYRARVRTSALREWSQLVVELRHERDRLQRLLNECRDRVVELMRRR